jgi:hypothetical protein
MQNITMEANILGEQDIKKVWKGKSFVEWLVTSFELCVLRTKHIERPRTAMNLHKKSWRDKDNI